MSGHQDMWERRYLGDGYRYGTEPNDFLRESTPLLPNGAALCLAEGEGRNAVYLALQGYEVSSVDLSPAAVRKTLRLAEENGVTVSAVAADLSDYDIGVESFDVIVSIFAHMPAAVRSDLHRRVIHALRPGGMFLLEAYTPAQIGRGTGGPQSPELAMTLEDLRGELAPLEFIHARELERSVLEGTGHTGVGAVVQVIARRPD